MCPGSQQLRQHGVSVVNELQWLRWHTWNYFTLKKVKTNKKCNFIFSKIACQSSRWLCGHINDYVDTFWKLWRLLTDFKGTLRQKKVFGCVYTSNGNNLKIWKPPYLKNDFLSLWSNIFVKTKKFPKLFWPVHMGPRSNLLSKQNGQKSRDTVPFRVHLGTATNVISDTL